MLGKIHQRVTNIVQRLEFSTLMARDDRVNNGTEQIRFCRVKTVQSCLGAAGFLHDGIDRRLTVAHFQEQLRRSSKNFDLPLLAT